MNIQHQAQKVEVKHPQPAENHSEALLPTYDPTTPTMASDALQRAQAAPQGISPAALLTLQRAAGNRAISHLLRPHSYTRPTVTSVGAGGGIAQRAAVAFAPNAPDIQAAFEPAYVNDAAQLHTIQSGKDKGTVSGGPKLKTGDEIQADETVTDGEWMAAQAGGKSGHIRTSKVVLKRTIVAPNFDTIEAESNTAEEGQELADKFGGGFDTLAGGIEQAYIKGNEGGKLKDLENQSHEGLKSGLDVVSGVGDTAMGIFGMIASAKKIISSEQKLSWDNLEAGYGFVESLGKGVSGATKIVDAFAKALGNKEGVGKSDVAGKITGAIADGLSGVKNAALGIIGLYRLFKSQSDQKGKDALVTLKTLADAAASAAKVAKNAFDIIGNGIPMALIYTIPALGIGVSAINLLIRLWDALKAGNIKGEMMKGADGLRLVIAANLGEAMPAEDNVTASKVFEGDRRGTFPYYQTYFRTRAAVRDGFKSIAEETKASASGINTKKDAAKSKRTEATQKRKAATDKQTELSKEKNPQKQKTLQTELSGLESAASTAEREATTAEDAHKAAYQTVKDKITAAKATPAFNALVTGQPGQPAVMALKKTEEAYATPPTASDTPKKFFDPIQSISLTIEEYEFADKMSEINQKRQTSGWTDVILELVSMAGDITTIAVGATGIGAAIGQGIKAASAGYKVVHGGSKFVQKLYRNRGQGEDKKSSMNKHKEYVRHARFIYQQVAELNPSRPPTSADQAKAKSVESYIRATGVNYGMWAVLKTNPQTQVEMLVESMKQRS